MIGSAWALLLEAEQSYGYSIFALADDLLLLAVLVFLNTLPVLWFKEPDHQKMVSSSSKKLPARTRIKAYFQYFSADSTLATWLLVLLTFKVADGLSGPLLKPLMVDLGLSFSQIGIYVTMLGALQH